VEKNILERESMKACGPLSISDRLPLLLGADSTAASHYLDMNRDGVTRLEKLKSDCTLKNGAFVHIRPIRPEDECTLVEGFKHLSLQTVYQRFLSPLPELTPSMARHLSNVDYYRRLALIAETDAELAGVARYEPTDDPGVAELGLVIVDHWQHRGLGRILLHKILGAAEENGIHRFRADVLAENRRMLRLLAADSQIQDAKTEGCVTTISFTSRPR
jgi:RimJ/RimL family protein N-acetyltransferase